VANSEEKKLFLAFSGHPRGFCLFYHGVKRPSQFRAFPYKLSLISSYVSSQKEDAIAVANC